MLVNGKCHCGNIAFELEWGGDSAEIPARACGCSFCVKHGGVWTSHPKSRLAVAIRDASLVSKYAFGSGTASSTSVALRRGATRYQRHRKSSLAVVNVNVFEKSTHRGCNWRSPTRGEDVEACLARRRRNWIPDVRIAGKRLDLANIGAVAARLIRQVTRTRRGTFSLEAPCWRLLIRICVRGRAQFCRWGNEAYLVGDRLSVCAVCIAVCPC